MQYCIFQKFKKESIMNGAFAVTSQKAADKF